MESILMLIAVVFYIAALVCGMFMSPNWKAVGIEWMLLALGWIFMGLALML